VTPAVREKVGNIFLAAIVCEEGWDESLRVGIVRDIPSHKVQLASDLQGYE